MDDKRIEVFIPRGGDRNYLLPRGKKSMVPPAVAGEIARGEKAAEQLYESMAVMKNTGK